MHDVPEELHDFRNFLTLVWRALGLPDPAPIQYDTAEYLQDGPDRKMVSAMRGFGKSYETAALAAHWLLMNPNKTVLCVSAASNRAREFIRLTRQLLELIPFCHHLRPGIHDRDGADRFDVGCRTLVSKDPSVAAYGITSMITGTHVDLIIIDDVETKDNSMTVESRERLYLKCMEFESILNPGGVIIYLGTPQSRESIYNRLSNHYALRRWPARYPDPENEDACKNLAPKLLEDLLEGRAQPGDPTFPERFNEQALIEREAIMGPSEFALQMLLDTTLSDENRYPLKLKDLIVMPVNTDVAPTRVVWGTTKAIQDIPLMGLNNDRLHAPIFTTEEFIPFESSVMFVDPAGTGSDEVGYAIVKLLHGTLFVPEVGSLPGGHDDATLGALASAAKRNGVKRIVVESNFGDGIYEKVLGPVVARVCGPVAIEGQRAKGQKELRIIDTLEPVMAQHRLVVDPRVARFDKFQSQLTSITRDRGSLKQDGVIDALAGAVAIYKDSMAVDSAKVVEEAARAEREQAALEFELSWRRGHNGRAVVRGSRDDYTIPENTQGLGSTQGGWGSKRWGRKSWLRR